MADQGAIRALLEELVRGVAVRVHEVERHPWAKRAAPRRRAVQHSGKVEGGAVKKRANVVEIERCRKCCEYHIDKIIIQRHGIEASGLDFLPPDPKYGQLF